MSRYVNACIWIACAILIVGFITVLTIGQIGNSDRITAEINSRGFPVHDVYVDSWNEVVYWTSNDNTKRCNGRYDKFAGLVIRECHEIVQASNEELIGG
jgi:hypothetical protein